MEQMSTFVENTKSQIGASSVTQWELYVTAMGGADGANEGFLPVPSVETLSAIAKISEFSRPVGTDEIARSLADLLDHESLGNFNVSLLMSDLIVACASVLVGAFAAASTDVLGQSWLCTVRIKLMII